MFCKLAILVSIATTAVSVAAVTNSCNAGPVQCCDTMKEADTDTLSKIQDLFSVTAPANGFVGFQCSPISGAGAGSSANCATQPVCCSDNHFDGLFAVGCNPVNGMA